MDIHYLKLNSNSFTTSFVFTEKVARRCSVLGSLFNKVVSLWSVTLFKRDSGTGDFLWVLRNFSEHHFYGTPPVATSVFILNQKYNNIQNSFEPVHFLVTELRLQFESIVFFCIMSQVSSLGLPVFIYWNNEAIIYYTFLIVFILFFIILFIIS